MEQVRKIIEQYHMLCAGDRVLVGISGGPDSVALLHLLWSLKDYYGISLYGVHVNHMLRPEAEAETEHVRLMAEMLQIPLKIYYKDVSSYARDTGMSVEQAGHELRFQCFREVAAEWQCNRLALGHHSGDAVESMLMHLIQGCGPKGLIAMPAVNGWIIRPLIACEKNELVNYCLGNNLHFDTDASNFEADCFRNKIRLELLPQLQQYNPELKSALCRLREILADEDDYMESQAGTVWKQWREQTIKEGEMIRISFPAEVFRAQPTAIRRRLFRRMWQEITGTDADLRYAQMEQMDRIAEQHDGSRRISLPHKTEFYREYNRIGMETIRSRSVEYDVLWDGSQPLLLADGDICFQMMNNEDTNGSSIPVEMAMGEHFHEETDRSAYKEEIFSVQIAFPLRIRTRREGDMLLIGNGKHKKLKKFFIDEKVPASIRDVLPLVCCGDTILWIPGYYRNPSVSSEEKENEKVSIRCFMK